MKITYDEDANAVYIYMNDIGKKVYSTYCCDPVEVKGMINLDFDKEGRLLGIEIMDADKRLSPKVLNAIKSISSRQKAIKTPIAKRTKKIKS